MLVGIVGAGMAGLACAEGLVRRGHQVVLFDKGRGPGGRMSSRRLQTPKGEAHFDHGAQYFNIREDGFQERVNAWIAEGVVARWLPAGRDAYVGVPAMNAPIQQMAAGQHVHWSTLVTKVERVDPGWRLFVESGEVFDVDMAVIAVPAEQTTALLAPVAPNLASCARGATSEPCWTVMLAFSEAVAAVGDCFRGDDIIEWSARNNSKPGRVGPESWVVQATADWSRRHLEAAPEWVASKLTEALSNLLDTTLPLCVGIASHRWRFARSAADGSGAILDHDRRLGICGDWLISPRVEAAWVSGTGLAELIGVGDGDERFRNALSRDISFMRSRPL
jgi:renalase